jgi:hypothetical protein
MTPALDALTRPEEFINAEQRAKLEGLERLWVAELITPRRYAKLRNVVLSESAPSWELRGARRFPVVDRLSVAVALLTAAFLSVGTSLGVLLPR